MSSSPWGIVSMRAFVVIARLVGLVGLVGSGATFSRQASRKGCPEVTTKPDFVVPPYLGDWYDIQSFPSFFQTGLSCVRARYGSIENGNAVSVYNVGMRNNGSLDEIRGRAYQPDPNNEPGRLRVDFPGSPTGTYLVLDTDYETFSAVYSCQAIGDRALEFAWILSREKTMSDELLHAVLDIFAGFGIDLGRFTTTHQGRDCVYPDSSLGGTRGMTNDSLTVVSRLVPARTFGKRASDVKDSSLQETVVLDLLLHCKSSISPVVLT
ncbi:unnamed protein product [Darwinula stevensoni]|uniref:Apolipoprotein D n=1 Tax=Darwinula stevensoni TaxID=69355 RepID=A0A7R8XGG3_9CRUS|nr:unnamed protein product [Darwinula stevensoni]CAG0891654.1 unnamed protein product [Darwinula stevensoni]